MKQITLFPDENIKTNIPTVDDIGTPTVTYPCPECIKIPIEERGRYIFADYPTNTIFKCEECKRRIIELEKKIFDDDKRPKRD